MKKFILLSILSLYFISICFSQTNMTDKPKAEIKHIAEDFPIKELDHGLWKKANSVNIKHYWSGEEAPEGRHFKTKLLWSDASLYVRFEANQKEPLNINDEPDLESKTDKLWEKDVCEIFLAPNRQEFRKYFEFEVAPTGEWIDLGIFQKPDERITDWDYRSGMKTAAKVKDEKVIMAFRVKWKAFGVTTPKTGDIWLGNILRAVGTEPNRGYLAWSPTLTEKPNFHVPEKFGQFEFVK